MRQLAHKIKKRYSWFRRWADASQPSPKTSGKQLISSSGC